MASQPLQDPFTPSSLMSPTGPSHIPSRLPSPSLLAVDTSRHLLKCHPLSRPFPEELYNIPTTCQPPHTIFFLTFPALCFYKAQIITHLRHTDLPVHLSLSASPQLDCQLL